MSQRMGPMDRMLALLRALSEASEGLSLQEMSIILGASRRTVERMRDVIIRHFDVIMVEDGRTRRWRLDGRLGRIFERPTSSELAALQAVVSAHAQQGSHATANLLASLLAKIQSALDSAARNRLAPDMEVLRRTQRFFVPAGPGMTVSPDTLASVQHAILAGLTLEFDYLAEGQAEPRWRRVIPCGLLQGPLSYLVGKFPDDPRPAVYFRLDRITNARPGSSVAAPPSEFDIDRWLSESFGIWRGDVYDICLEAGADAAASARNWRFHRDQVLEDTKDGALLIRFRASGLRELAEHLTTWHGKIRPLAPPQLIDEVRQIAREMEDCTRISP
jgi:proteasome accessory factor B